MYVRSRTSADDVKWIVIHTNEGPERDNSATGLALYLATIDGGYHEVIDAYSFVRTATDSQIVHGAGVDEAWVTKGLSANAHGYHVCLIGYAAQTSEQWADAYSKRELDLAAARVADACRRFSVPNRWLTVTELRAGVKGVTTHATISAAFLANRGDWHTDPGPFFPFDPFHKRIDSYLTPESPTEDDDMPAPTDNVDALTNKWGHWILTADGGVKTVRGKFYGSVPMLKPEHRQGDHFPYCSIESREGEVEGYVITSKISEFEFGPGMDKRLFVGDKAP